LIVTERLEKLGEYLKTLQAVQKYDLQRFKTDPFIHGAAERYLHLSIECLLDIGNHIIADRGYSKPETYSDIFRILSEENIISPVLLQELEGMAAFRNLLVHDYVRLDLDRVYRIIQEKLPHLNELACVYSGLL
jgi:uncharacterized protein YutE (UPF0331/DUF86 family)